ncbi:hypothetical protein SAMN05444959_105199 [Paracoccus seriniphilus]|uniref:Uncharacterized protein n=1 Tax=Paracoccus seriniphilus TaxID=184748 RepID=A0A239PUP4_9RHOB|nr:hypothetical protein SAMN05444959_105199 [Paracoccus seriniphilus]
MRVLVFFLVSLIGVMLTTADRSVAFNPCNPEVRTCE